MNDLDTLWTSGGGNVDVDALAKGAERGRRRQLARAIAEGVAGIAVLAFWGAVLATGTRPTIVLVMAGASALGLVVWWALLARNFRGTWRTSALGVDAFCVLEAARLRAGHRAARLSVIGVVVVAVALVAATPWIWAAGAEVYRAEPWRLVIAGLGLVAIVAGTAWQSARRRRRLEAALMELEAPGD